MHPKAYDTFLTMKDEKKQTSTQERLEHQTQSSSKFEQNDFNRIVLNFMINGMYHPKLLTDPLFEILLNGK